MKRMLFRMPCLLAILFGVVFVGPKAFAHSIHHQVEANQAVSVKIFYAPNDPASYSEYEIYGPGDGEPYQIGRTDRTGVLSFLPDRPGIWKAKVLGESSHGFHGVTIDIKIDQAFQLESFSKPLVAQHTKVIVGISVIFGLFGIVSLYLSRREKRSSVDGARGGNKKPAPSGKGDL